MGTSQLVRQVERRFGLRIGAVDVIRQGPGNHVCRLHSEGRNVFLKLRLDAFSRERVAEEVALLDHLREGGFSAPALVEDLSGESLFECTLDDAPVWGYLTEEVQIAEPGIDVGDDRHLRMAARMLAEFHTICGSLGSGFTVVHWSPHWLLDRNLQVVESAFAERCDDFDAICASLESLKSHLPQAREKREGAWGVIHGDLHASNVVIGAEGNLWLLDFESFGNGWRILDRCLPGEDPRPDLKP